MREIDECIVLDSSRIGRRTRYSKAMPRPVTQLWETDSLEDHVGLMRMQAEKSRADPGLRHIVSHLIRGSADDVELTLRGRVPVVRAWGRSFPTGKPKGAPVNPASDECKINAIWNFVVANVAYKKDPPQYDLFMTAEVMLKAGWGDCDDQTILLTAMASLAGLSPTYARVISTNGEHWSHVYAVVGARIEGRKVLVPLDPTVKGALPGWEFGRSKRVVDLRM